MSAKPLAPELDVSDELWRRVERLPPDAAAVWPALHRELLAARCVMPAVSTHAPRRGR